MIMLYITFLSIKKNILKDVIGCKFIGREGRSRAISECN